MSEEKDQESSEKNDKDSGEKDEIKKEIERLQKERDEYLAYAQRSRADFLNYKKQESERMRIVVGYEKEDWILDLLQLADLFEMAKKEFLKKENQEHIIQGFIQIDKKLTDFLKKHGVEEIDINLGDKFDPEIAEAVEMVAGKDTEKGNVAEVLQKGYFIKDKVLRPARVKVNN